MKKLNKQTMRHVLTIILCAVMLLSASHTEAYAASLKAGKANSATGL